MMNTRLKILPALCCISLLSACASNQPASVAHWSITPITTVNNASEKPEAMYQMGRYYQGQNRFDLAMAAYQKALAANDGFVEARNGMGVIYSRQGKYREAIAAFQAAIQQAPKAAHIYNNLGYAFYLQGQYGESVAALKQATALDPANQRAFNNLALAYAKAGNKDESVQAFAQAANVPAVAPGTAVAPLQNASPLPFASVVVAATSAETKVAPAPQPEVQMLALPKDKGIIRPASAAPTVPVVDSRVKLVQLAPNVYELHQPQYNAEPVQVAAVADIPSPVKVRVEVANGNGVTGMAGKVGQFLRSQGYPAARLTNQKPFQVQMTKIQYRDGHQAEAKHLMSNLPVAAELAKSNAMRADVNVRLVLGKDMVARLARFDGKAEKLQVALNASGS